jgi:hypothetical protein
MDGIQDSTRMVSQITSKGLEIPGSSWSFANSVIIYRAPSCGTVA